LRPRPGTVFVGTRDGSRWQGRFRWAGGEILSRENGGVADVEGLKTQFWRGSPEAGREALLPFCD